MLTPRLIKDIDFYPGNFGVKYGRATGGLVDVDITTDATPRLHGQVDVNVLDSSAYVEGPLAQGLDGLGVGAALVHRPAAAARHAVEHDDRRARVLGLSGRRAPRAAARGASRSSPSAATTRLKVVSKDPSRGNLSLGTETLLPQDHRRSGRRRATAGSTASRPPTATEAQLRRGAGRHRLDRRTRSSCATSCRGSSARTSSGASASTARRPTEPLRQRAARAGHAPLRRRARPCSCRRRSRSTRSARRSTPTRRGSPAAACTITPGLRGDYFHYVDQDRFTLRPAHRRALEGDAQARRQGRRRHLPPDAGAAAPRREVRQPDLAADLGRSVLARLRAAPHRQALARHDLLLRASATTSRCPSPAASRPRGASARTAWSSSSSTSSRSASSAGSPTRSRAPSRRPTPSTAPRRATGHGLPADGRAGHDLVPDRLRPDAQPHRRRQLHLARLALRHALPARHGRARHADVRGHVRRRLRRLRLPARPHERRRASRPSTSSTCASSARGPSTPGSSARTSTCRTSTTRRTPSSRSTTIGAAAPSPSAASPSCRSSACEGYSDERRRMKTHGLCPLRRARASRRSPLGAGACGDLDNITTVKDLRVLAVKSEPAGFLVPLDDPGSLTNTTATLTALVVDPLRPSDILTLTGEACPDYIDTITAASGQSSKLCPRARRDRQVPGAARHGRSRRRSCRPARPCPSRARRSSTTRRSSTASTPAQLTLLRSADARERSRPSTRRSSTTATSASTRS